MMLSCNGVCNLPFESVGLRPALENAAIQTQQRHRFEYQTLQPLRGVIKGLPALARRSNLKLRLSLNNELLKPIRSLEQITLTQGNIEILPWIIKLAFGLSPVLKIQ
jgi:hypothetical protein